METIYDSDLSALAAQTLSDAPADGVYERNGFRVIDFGGQTFITAIDENGHPGAVYKVAFIDDPETIREKITITIGGLLLAALAALGTVVYLLN